MFSWLKKKSAVYPAKSRWTVLNGENEGKPMFLRRNDSGRELSGHSEYRYRVAIAVSLKSPNEHGLPGPEEMESLNTIEDHLSLQLEANQLSLYVLAITTGGMREFVFYTRDPSSAKGAVDALRGEVQSHELQTDVAEDPEWQFYRQFA